MPNTRSSSRGITILVAIAALILIAGGLRAIATVVNPLLLALFLAIVSSPPITRLRAWGVPGPLSILIVACVYLGLAALFSAVMAVSAGDLSDSLPEYQLRVEAMFESTSAWVASYGLKIETEDLKRLVNPSAAIGMAGNFLSGLGALFANGILVALLMIFILLEASSIPTKLTAMTSDPERAKATLDKLRSQVDVYFGVLTVLSAATGLLVYLLLRILGVDLALFWALLAFLLNFIPNIGSILAAVPAVMLALVQLGPGSAVLVMLGYLSINMVIGNIVQPRLMGRDLGLSTLTVFVSLLVWGWLLGPVGMLVSVPLTSAIRLALAANEATRPIAVLMGTEEAARQLAER